MSDYDNILLVQSIFSYSNPLILVLIWQIIFIFTYVAKSVGLEITTSDLKFRMITLITFGITWAVIETLNSVARKS